MASYNPLRDVERLADVLLSEPLRGPRQMPMDLYRDGDHYLLTADLPGMDPGSVDIFLRQLSLGQGIDTERISASYDNGVLCVTIPVSERAKPRKVEVMTGGAGETPQTIQASDPTPAQLENSPA
jgi:HSP20 family protein